MSRKVAVVLFNLGGPDSPAAVRPFLFNLFNDPAIIGAPAPVRWLIAQLISRRRAPIAREIYEHLGGGSPLLPNTRAQAEALEEVLSTRDGDIEAKAFIAMRYWHPRSEAVAKEVAAWGPDEVLLLPLYPQFSTTTTGSSVTEWQRKAAAAGVTAPTRSVCCWPLQAGFVEAAARLTREGMDRAGAGARVLFSAHGLPKKIVDKGDPYQWQVERTCEAVAAAAGLAEGEWVVCYQSRVGPLEWIGPSTDEEIERAGGEGLPVVVVPIAFVSEHSETLVELDIEYRKLAEEKGVPGYVRVSTVDTDAAFISGLADVVTAAVARPPGVASETGERLCPADWRGCPVAGNG